LRSALVMLIHRVGSRQLYPWRRIAWISGLWLAAIAAGRALYWRYVPDGIVSTTTVLFGLIVLVPVLGIMAAPMALHWNRCR